MNYMKEIVKSILAGIMIGLAGWVYLKLGRNIIGACLFSIGLISVFSLELNLYTGKVGSNAWFKDLYLIRVLLMNLVGVLFIGLVSRLDNTVVQEAGVLINNKINIDIIKSLWLSIFCGVIIELSVQLYKKHKNYITTIICVVLFISCGFEHCIANAYYIVVANADLTAILYLGLWIAGNAIGGKFLNQLCSILNE